MSHFGSCTESHLLGHSSPLPQQSHHELWTTSRNISCAHFLIPVPVSIKFYLLLCGLLWVDVFGKISEIIDQVLEGNLYNSFKLQVTFSARTPYIIRATCGFPVQQVKGVAIHRQHSWLYLTLYVEVSRASFMDSTISWSTTVHPELTSNWKKWEKARILLPLVVVSKLPSAHTREHESQQRPLFHEPQQGKQHQSGQQGYGGQ